MLEISSINNTPYIKSNGNDCRKISVNSAEEAGVQNQNAKADSESLKAYHPSFCGIIDNSKNGIAKKKQFSAVSKKLDSNTLQTFKTLNRNGILDDKSSNDGSTVLENLYKIISEPRVQGLDDSLILTEVINSLANPESITQKFGDLPDEIIPQIEQETGEAVPEEAKQVASSSCVAASIEYNLASKKPAEFARFAQGLSSENYSVNKKIKMSDINDGFAASLWKLREFNTDSKVLSWDDVEINIQPDRNAIVRARVQTSYQDPGERSCVDVLIQSALLNLGSQASYNAITDERAGTLNPDKYGLNDMEKNFVENIVMETPKVSVLYQNINNDGKLEGYYSEREETKNHILRSLELGQNVIIGYTHFDENNRVNGGHEITITGYVQDEQGNGSFVCNDTDDEIDSKILIAEDKLLPLIHHAGISKEALAEDDVIVQPWKEILEEVKSFINENDNSEA